MITEMLLLQIYTFTLQVNLLIASLSLNPKINCQHMCAWTEYGGVFYAKMIYNYVKINDFLFLDIK